MGVMYGKVRDHTFWIMDAAALPVQGTETRVNAGNEVGFLSSVGPVSLINVDHRLWNTWSTSRSRMQKLRRGRC